MDNIQQWVQAIQSETAALEFLRTTEEGWNIFASCGDKTSAASTFTTNSQLRKIGEKLNIGADYILKKNASSYLTKFGFLVEIKTMAQAAECSKLNMAMIQQDALDRFNLEGFE